MSEKEIDGGEVAAIFFQQTESFGYKNEEQHSRPRSQTVVKQGNEFLFADNKNKHNAAIRQVFLFLLFRLKKKSRNSNVPNLFSIKLINQSNHPTLETF